MNESAPLPPDVWDKTPTEARELIKELQRRVDVLSDRPVVISLHGIRTRGRWQKDVASDLSAEGMIVESLDYGFFWALQLLWPPSRRKKIDWFRDEYERVCVKFNVDRPSIIAHSFGTYLVAGGIEIYDLRFDRVILCGSIVRQDYPWDAKLRDDRAQAVLNDYGHTDLWARVVAYAVHDGGQSGLRGFGNGASQIVQRGHPKWRHSDYFHAKNYKDIWIPFLGGTTPEPLPIAPKAAVNWKFWATVVLLIVLAALAAWWWITRPPGPSGWKRLQGAAVAVPVAVTQPIESDASRHRENTVVQAEQVKPEDPYLVFAWEGDKTPTSIRLKGEFEHRARLGVCLTTNSSSRSECTIQVSGIELQVPTTSGDRIRLAVFPFDNDLCQQFKRRNLNEFIDVSY